MTMISTPPPAANHGNGNCNVDTSLTKVFVGGLAWETPKEALRDHFHRFGDIVEAVIISDKLTGRSKGYGFVTFKDSNAAANACRDPSPVINGRRANCNLAALGARRPSFPPPPTGVNNNNNSNNVVVGTRPPTVVASTPPPQVQWYYPTGSAAAVPFYGYSPAYMNAPSDVNYAHNKVGYVGGSYMNGPYSHVYQHQTVVGPAPHNTTLLTVYPVYQFHPHSQSQAMGLPAHLYSHGPISTLPALFPLPSTAPGTTTVGKV